MDRDELLTELFGETAEEALPGLEDLGFIVGETLFGIIDAFDHDAPEEDGELVRQGLVGDEAAATRGHPSVVATEGDVFAARQGASHHTEDLPGAVAASLDPGSALAALGAARREPEP